MKRQSKKRKRKRKMKSKSFVLFICKVIYCSHIILFRNKYASNSIKINKSKKDKKVSETDYCNPFQICLFLKYVNKTGYQAK